MDLVERYPDIRWDIFCGEKELNGEPAALNRYVNVYYQDEDVRVLSGLDTRVEQGATITVLPATSGG